MDAFLGRSKPAPKEKRDSKEANKVYDGTKRKRKIQQSWRDDFAWLITDDKEEVLYCKICRAVYGPLATKTSSLASSKLTKYSKGSLVQGSKSLRRDGLQDHDESDGHKDAVSIYRVRKSTPSEKAEFPGAKILETLNTKNFDRLKKLYTNAHALVKLSRPISDFVAWCKADEKKGVDIGVTYWNSHSCKEFIVSMAEVARGEIESKLTEASFISIMADGSTDISTVENEVVYVHFSVKGVVHCYFLGMIPCENGRAQGIYQAIISSLNFEHLSTDDVLKKVVSYVGDGAAVNTGLENGVIALFRQKVNSSIIMVKCLSHRVELAFKDALKKSPLFRQVLECLDLIFKFYHKSAKQTAELKVACESLDMGSVSHTRIGGTRWVGHTQTALKNFLKAYRPTTMHLSQVSIFSTMTILLTQTIPLFSFQLLDVLISL